MKWIWILSLVLRNKEARTVWNRVVPYYRVSRETLAHATYTCKRERLSLFLLLLTYLALGVRLLWGLLQARIITFYFLQYCDYEQRTKWIEQQVVNVHQSISFTKAIIKRSWDTWKWTTNALMMVRNILRRMDWRKFSDSSHCAHQLSASHKTTAMKGGWLCYTFF